MLGVRVGEASNPGPASLRRLRRNRSATFAISSDEEPLIRGIGRNVVARVEGELDDTPIEGCSETIPESQSAVIAVVSEAVPSHIMDALEEDLDQVEERVPDIVLDSLAEDRSPVLVPFSSFRVRVRGNHQKWWT